MALLTTQSVTLVGTSVTYAAVNGGGDTFVPGDRVYLSIKNGAGSPITATAARGHADIGGVALTGWAMTVPAGAQLEAGPFSNAEFFNPATQTCALTYSSGTSVTIAVTSR